MQEESGTVCLHSGVVTIPEVERCNVRTIGTEKYALNIFAVCTADSLKLNLACLFVVDVILSGREEECRSGILAAIGSSLAQCVKIVLSIIGNCSELLYGDLICGGLTAASGKHQTCGSSRKTKTFS